MACSSWRSKLSSKTRSKKGRPAWPPFFNTLFLLCITWAYLRTRSLEASDLLAGCFSCSHPLNQKVSIDRQAQQTSSPPHSTSTFSALTLFVLWGSIDSSCNGVNQKTSRSFVIIPGSPWAMGISQEAIQRVLWVDSAFVKLCMISSVERDLRTRRIDCLWPSYDDELLAFRRVDTLKYSCG